MSKTTWKTGDLVQLKSGGPVMTINNADHYGKAECQWFSGKKLEHGYFDPITLVEAVVEEVKK